MSRITLERRGDYVHFYHKNMWIYEVKVDPELYPDIQHLRDKSWFTKEVEQQLFDILY